MELVLAWLIVIFVITALIMWLIDDEYARMAVEWTLLIAVASVGFLWAVKTVVESIR